MNTSDKDTDTVQKELQRIINEASDWGDNDVMILHPTKTKINVRYLLLGQIISFARFTLVLKTVVLNKFMNTGTSALLLMMNLAGDHTLLGQAKQYPKNLYLLSQLNHFVDAPTRKLFYHDHISTYGCSDISDLTNSLHRSAAKLIYESSLTTDTKLRYFVN